MHFLLKIYPYFNLFNATVNGIVFLISFLDCSFQVFRNTIDFPILILYPATLLNVFISSNGFLVILKDFLYIKLYHLQTEIVLLFFLSLFFFLLSGLTILARNRRTLLQCCTEMVRADIHVLFLTLWRKHPIFHH